MRPRSRVEPVDVVSIASIVLIALALTGRASPAAAVELAVGQRFPDLVLPALADSSPLSLRQFRGQKVILHVFASW